MLLGHKRIVGVTKVEVRTPKILYSCLVELSAVNGLFMSEIPLMRRHKFVLVTTQINVTFGPFHWYGCYMRFTIIHLGTLSNILGYLASQYHIGLS
jgi:hypothetical protein